MRVLWSMDCHEDDWRRLADWQRDRLNDWLRSLGGDPDVTRSVEVVADGDGMVAVEVYDEGLPLTPDGLEIMRHVEWYPLTSYPPLRELGIS